jgi:hypothetical protein
MNRYIISLTDEYGRYKKLAEGALAQVPDAQLSEPGPGNGNSLAQICWHLSGNLQSRFSDFLTSDGEKPWRNREEEFDNRTVSRAELMTKWDGGWKVLLDTLDSLSDADLDRSVTIRGTSLTVYDALFRSLAHASYHVGQIVYIAHYFVGAHWKYLTIPPGGSAAYNAAPVFEKPTAHAAHVNNVAPTKAS